MSSELPNLTSRPFLLEEDFLMKEEMENEQSWINSLGQTLLNFKHMIHIYIYDIILYFANTHNSNMMYDFFSSFSVTSSFTSFAYSGERRDVRPGAPSEPNEYNFNFKKRGLFILINNRHFEEETGQQPR